MNNKSILTPEQKEVLEQARKAYGDTNQVLVSTEELCELAAVCAKYPRYGTKEKAQAALQAAATDEVADVLIVLDHIINIFGISDEAITGRIAGKIERLSRWLNKSHSMEQTTVDRAVRPSYCASCFYTERPFTAYPCPQCQEKVDEAGNRTGTQFKPRPNCNCKGCQHFGDFSKLIDTCGPCVTNNGCNFKAKEGTVSDTE